MTPPRKVSPAKAPGVVVIAGQEDFLVRKELERLVRENVSDEARTFDFSEYRSADIEPGTLWNALITLPLLASRRIVILHMTSDPKDELLRVLNRYATHPSTQTLFIIVQVFEERGTPVRLEGDVQVRTFPLISNVAKRVQWAQDYARESGKELPPEAAEYIVSNSSTRLSDIASKLDRAMLYAGDQKQITGQTLMAVSGVTSEYLPWEVEDAILERHAGKIFERVWSIESGGEELLRLLAYQRGALMQLWRIGALARKIGIKKLDKTSKDLLFRESQAIMGNKAFKSVDLCKAYIEIGEQRIRQSVVDLIELEERVKTGRGGWRGYYDWLWRLIAPPVNNGTSSST